MKIKKIISVLLLVGLLLGVMIAPCSVSASAQTYAQSYLEEQMEKNNISGVAYVTKNGKVICQSARGMANAVEGKEITIDTLFPIGSNSKQFCAAAILILQEQGKLSVNDTITAYFPEYTQAKEVTIKHLLTMRSGICDHLTDGLWAGDITVSTEATEEENQRTILEWVYGKKLLFKAGYNFRYSNTNYLLLSMIVEQVSGQDYNDFIKENIFEPLCMDSSGFYEELMNHPDLAVHTSPNPGPIEPEYKGFIQGAGDLVSNAEDLDKWMTSLREYTILSEESVSEMATSYTPSEGYGYGIGVWGDGGLFYNGGIVSYLSVLFTYPKYNFNVFVVSNDYDTGLTGAIEFLAIDLAEKLKDLNLFGDVNSDFEVNIKDATLIQKASAKLIEFSEVEALCADVNSDSDVNIKDATVIQKHIASINTGFPVGNPID